MLEKVQKRATKLIPAIKTMTYTERLKACKLPTLHYRHIRGNMIEMYTILSGKYDTALIPRVNREHGSVTRGKILGYKNSSELRTICASIVLLIGLLTFGTVYHVVLSDTVNTFKSRLDKFWQHQDIIYDIKRKFMEPEVGVVIRY